MNKVKQNLFQIWIVSTAVLAGLVWCIIYFMPNDGWLYWASIASIIVLAILYIGAIVVTWLSYEMFLALREWYYDFKSRFRKFMEDPIGCIIRGEID